MIDKEFILSCLEDLDKTLDEQIDIVNAIADEWNDEILGECRQEVLHDIRFRYNNAYCECQATNMSIETFRNLLNLCEGEENG